MQTESFVPSLYVFLELMAVASICGWTACLLIGMSLFSPDKAVLVGTCGIVVGGAVSQFLALPEGPSMGHFALVPSFLGTLTVAFLAELVSEFRASPFRRPGERRALGREVPLHAASDGAASAPAEESPAPVPGDEPHPASP
jgi:uncharacterized membrane protein YeaQ/YmgE (transglycosylase-associated protein family)